jgi:hypothetical protein
LGDLRDTFDSLHKKSGVSPNLAPAKLYGTTRRHHTYVGGGGTSMKEERGMGMANGGDGFCRRED